MRKIIGLVLVMLFCSTATGEGSAQDVRSVPSGNGLSERCTWAFRGARTVTCDGETYCFGTATCSSGIRPNVFCSSDSCGGGATACAADHNEKTRKCYLDMVAQGQPTSILGQDDGAKVKSKKRSRSTDN